MSGDARTYDSGCNDGNTRRICRKSMNHLRVISKVKFDSDSCIA
jgi:hypothetical protein